MITNLMVLNFLEVAKVQASGRVPPKDFKYLDVYRDKPNKVTVKVLVPVKEHPKASVLLS